MLFLVQHQTSERWMKLMLQLQRHWDLHELGDDLIALEGYVPQLALSPCHHCGPIIGDKSGTGGVSGVSYLRKMLDLVLFPELWKLRTDL